MEVQNLKVCDITPSAMNPRKTFDKESLAELAENIKNQGLLQPITVRPVPEEASVKINKDGSTSEFKYEIVCGERRFRACKMNGMEYILGIVREMSDEEAYDAMITENLQRRDVDPIEEAFAFSELMKRGGKTKDIAARFGKSERFVQDRVRLNGLIDELKTVLREGRMPIRAAFLIAKFSDEDQKEFYEDGSIGLHQGYEVDYDDVKNWVDDHFDILDNVPFLTDKKEGWHDGKEFPKCETCLCNTSNHGCLFYEMKEKAKCTKPECKHKKAQAYVWKFIHEHDFLKKGEVWRTGKMVLFGAKVPSQFWDDDVKEAYKELVKKIEDEGYEMWYYEQTNGKIYYDREDARYKEELASGNAVEVLEIANFERLNVSGWRLMRELRKNNVAELVRNVKELEDIQSDVDSEVRKTFDYTAHDGGLEPFEEIALSAIMIKNTNNLATKFFNKDSWQIKDEEVIAFVEQHEDMLAAIMTSYLKQQLEAYTYSGFRKYVLEHTQPGTYEEIEGRVRTSHQKRIDGYVAQLEELGYDKDGNPIEKEAQ